MSTDTVNKDIEQNVANDDRAWLILKVRDQHYAVSCQDVLSIMIADMEVTPVSGYSGEVKGVMDFRGSVIPVMELRNVLGEIGFDEEHQEFIYMMEERKEDHRNWVNELVRCTTCGERFTLAKDPHQCKFGKWYDNFKPSNQAVAFDLRKIEEPHRLLHETAQLIEDSMKLPEGERETQINNLLAKAEKEYMKKVLALLDDLKEIYKSGFREMCIVLSNEEGKMLALLVDEVKSVDILRTVNSQDLFDASVIDHVARSSNFQGEVFVLDRDALFRRLF
ncbi:MAG: chemotaxis protein CheW [Anaerovoracaceae bacterium]